MFIESENYVFTHAPLHSQLSLTEASDLGTGFDEYPDNDSNYSLIWNRYVPDKPHKYLDLSVVPPTNMIQTHDGSIIIAFNDFRDDVILTLENRIYDSIPEEYKGEVDLDFDYIDYVDSGYRVGEMDTLFA
jgi:hypothetical protein